LHVNPATELLVRCTRVFPSDPPNFQLSAMSILGSGSTHMQGSMRVSHLQLPVSFCQPLSILLFSVWATNCRCVHPLLQLQQPMLGVRNANSKAIGRMSAIKTMCTNRGQREHSSCWIRRYAWSAHMLMTIKPWQVFCSAKLSADNFIKVYALQ